jgi:hypothetical protein
VTQTSARRRLRDSIPRGAIMEIRSRVGATSRTRSAAGPTCRRSPSHADGRCDAGVDRLIERLIRTSNSSAAGS